MNIDIKPLQKGESVDSTIIAATIGTGGALIGIFVRPWVEQFFEKRKVGVGKYPSIQKTWEASWYIDGKLFVADKVRITKQRGSKFEGIGSGGGDKYPSPYNVVGQFNSHGVITFSYDFGFESYAMVGCGVLKVDPSLETCQGWWSGYSKSGDLVSGKVIWTS